MLGSEGIEDGEDWTSLTLSAVREGTLPQLISRTVVEGHFDGREEALRQSVVQLHNEGRIDLLPIVAALAQDDPTYEFFMVQQFLVKALPELDADVAPMMAAVGRLVETAGNDGVAGMPNGSYRTWAGQGDRAVRTLDAVDPDKASDTSFVMLALQAMATDNPMAALDRAIGLAIGNALFPRMGAVKAIGSFDLGHNTVARMRALDALDQCCQSCDDDNLRGLIIAAAVAIAVQLPFGKDEACIALVRRANSDGGDLTVHHASASLMFEAEQLSDEMLAELQPLLIKVKPDSLGTLQQIDLGIGSLLRKGRVAQALALLNPLLLAQPNLRDLKTLRSTRHALSELGPKERGTLLARWLLTGEPSLCHAAAAVVGEARDHQSLQLDAAVLPLSEEQVTFVARKAIGFFFIHPLVAGSMLLELLRLPGISGRDTADLLFDPLLLNYSGELREWLAAEIDTDDPVYDHVAGAIEKIDAYLTGLGRIGTVPELRPSEREWTIQANRQRASMRAISKAAEAESVLLSLVKRSTLLYGGRSISYLEDERGHHHRSEIRLGSFSHSVEWPRLQTIEPFDLDHMLRVFRTERLP